jgi:dihydrofolate reductase
MSKVILDISMSLDGFIAGPNDGPDQSLGENGHLLVAWFFGDQNEADAAIARETGESTGAYVIGRRMYDIGEGPNGWGDGGPNGTVPVFVLCHEPRKSFTKASGTTFTFVSDGIVSALDKAKAAAGNKDVLLMGANTAQQYLTAGLADELLIHLVPVLLGGGLRVFDRLGPGYVQLEKASVVDSNGVTHLRYRIPK